MSAKVSVGSNPHPSYPMADIQREAQRLANPASARVQEGYASRAYVRAVKEESPADDAGFEPGCWVTSVDGKPLRDIIDWRWLSACDEMCVGYIDLEGDEGEVYLEREEGEEWGFEFQGVIFDSIKQCRNACTFCFMRQLPEAMRASLTLRDDDFRLSFLSGTFVTFTNLSPEDERRIVEQRISPLRVSLHASNASVRRTLIGRHAQHGIDVLDRLLAQGIEFHAQIVLVPGENDGAVLEETLSWAYERAGILNVGVVPLGFTKHQEAFDRSFNEAGTARGVLDAIAPYGQRAVVERGFSWVYAADEFYTSAYGCKVLDHLPPARFYGDFSMFEDGIGIVRAQVDEWQQAHVTGVATVAAHALSEAKLRVCFIAGEAMRGYLSVLIKDSPLAACMEALYVENTFFGGNVDVTGLLVGEDIARTVRLHSQAPHAFEPTILYALPRVVFNDDGVMLDDLRLNDVEMKAGVPLAVVSCTPSEFLEEITALALARQSS